MLKLAKWAYDLGVRHERTRIASHLQVAAANLRTENEAMDYMIRDNKELKAFKAKRQQKLELSMAVNNKVQTIIQDMYESRGEWTPGPSLMFPEEKK